jgi:small subunit ribosomal protein S17
MLVGQVVSDKMTNTIVVKVTTFKQHPLYHKRFRWTKKFLADTTGFEPKLGDTVRIESSKPLSKLKRWRVAEVMAEATVVQAKAAKKSETAAKPKTATKRKSKTTSKGAA